MCLPFVALWYLVSCGKDDPPPVLPISSNEAPVFSEDGTYTFTVSEDAVAGATIGTVSATDADTGTTLQYNITTSQTNFTIDASSGMITLANGITLDFETIASYSLTVEVEDGNDATDEASVTINVTNVDEAPTFDFPNAGDTEYTLSIDENTTTPAAVAMISATDPEGAALTYTITPAHPDFEITAGTDVASGDAVAITAALGTVLDYENVDKRVYTLTIEVTDGTNSVDVPATITVEDVNEPPAFVFANATDTKYSFTIAADALTIGTVQATDPDTETAFNTLTYSTLASTPDNFMIDGSSGAITVQTALTENTTITVQVSDGTNAVPAAVDIVVSGLNTAPEFVFIPSTATEYSFTIAADATEVGSISAIDPDVGAMLTYSLSGTGSDNFVLDPLTAVASAAEVSIDVAPGASLSSLTSPVRLTVTVSDGTDMATAPVVIAITPVVVSNAAPAFVFASAADTEYSFMVSADADEGDVVGMISATDPDTGDLLTYTITPASTDFAIVGGTDVASDAEVSIEVKAGASLSVGGVTIMVTVSDDGTPAETDMTDVVITITPVVVLNAVPVFVGSPYTFSIAEDAAMDTAVGTVTATDTDDDDLTYRITTTQANFDIGSSSGAITVSSSASLDYETATSYSLTVEVSDGTDTATESVTINVSDVNEAPEFVFDPPSATEYSFEVPVDAATDDVVGMVSAMDVDAGALLTYTITSASSDFAIVGGTDVVPDEEVSIAVASGASLSVGDVTIMIMVSDNGTPAETDMANVEITVSPVFEFSASTYSFSVAENSDGGTVLTGATSGDVIGVANVPVGSTARYSITDGDPDDYFVIDATSGALTVSSSAMLNYEVAAAERVYTLTLEATAGLSTATATVSIMIEDVNEAPVFGTLPTLMVAENAASGDAVGTAITATDPDTDNTAFNTLSYSILTPDPSSNFEINMSTGQLSVLSTADLNFEDDTKNSFTLMIEVYDQLHRVPAEVTIEVTDADDAPMFTFSGGGSAYVFSAADATAATTSIGTVSATDEDTGQSITGYTLSGTGSDDFAISTGGAITVASSVTLSNSRMATYALTVTAMSTGTLDGTADVTINVDPPPANAAPTFVYGASLTAYTFEIAENSSSGTALTVPTGGAEISAMDTDGDQLSYSITGGNEANNFQIPTAAVASGAEVMITVTDMAMLDLESTTSYTLTIEVNDGNGNRVEASVMIGVMNVNEAPEFASTPYTFMVAIDAAMDDVVGMVSATDVDAGALLTYELSGGDASNFAISSTPVATGVEVAITVSATATLSSLTSPVTLMVMVSDNGTPALTETEEVVIMITNQPPTVTGLPATLTVFENATSGTVLDTFSATDPETTAITYTLTGTGNSNFAITPTTAASGVDVDLTVAATADLDYEDDTKNSFTITITATDANGASSVGQVVAITVENIDEAPEFEMPLPALAVDENSVSGDVGSPLTAVDPEGAAVSYSIETTQTDFTIDMSTGQLSVLASAMLDFETTPTIDLTIAATAAGSTETTDIAVTITINDVNETPAFAAASYSFMVREDAASTVVVGTVSATDPDTGDMLTYTLMPASSGFEISSTAVASGVGVPITVGTADLDFEDANKDSFTITIRTADTGGAFVEAMVTITVEDVDEPPMLTGLVSPLTVSENANSGTLITFSATDPEGMQITYETDGEGSDNFVIVPTSAASDADVTLMVASTADLDFEDANKNSFMITIRATDTGANSISQVVAIMVQNVDEAPEFNPLPTDLMVDENSTSGDVGSAITATDPEGDEVSYSIQTTQTDFTIGTSSGQLSVLSSAMLDFEANPTRTLMIRAASTSLMTDIAVTITLNDLDADSDGDGLIEIRTLEQLNAIRYDVSGNGITTAFTTTAGQLAAYTAAFPEAPGPEIRSAGNTPDPANTEKMGYELVANLDFTGSAWATGLGWTPLFMTSDPFTGQFEGNGNTISNLLINRNEVALGLFAELGNGVMIRNLHLANVNVTSTYDGTLDNVVGALIGTAGPYRDTDAASNISVTNCSVSGGTVSSSATTPQIGGLIGVSRGSVSDCYSTATVSTTSATGTHDVGGLIGRLGDAAADVTTAENCYATGTVSASGANPRIGGLIGISRGSVSNCYSTAATVTTTSTAAGTHDVGGLIGRLGDAAADVATAENCYATGNVEAAGTTAFVGGLIGDVVSTTSGHIRYSYATGNVTATATVTTVHMGGLVGRTVAPIAACYARGNVSGTTDTDTGSNVYSLGGFVGTAAASIEACYASGTVTERSMSADDNVRIGGFVGYLFGSITLQNSYAVGLLTRPGTDRGAIHSAGGLYGDINTLTTVTINNSYFDSQTTGQTVTATHARTTTDLQGPGGYSGIYLGWAVDIDGTTVDWWDFGSASQYPVLKVDFNGDSSTADDVTAQRTAL